MNKQTATQLIFQTFEAPFDEQRFANLARNLFNQIDESKAFSQQGPYISDAFKEHVRQYKRLGTYTDPEGMNIDILIVRLKKESGLERARTMQRNFVARYLRERDKKDAAVVAYYSDNQPDWRFSLVKMEYEITSSESTGNLKTQEILTPARRYSFLVGQNEPNHTAQQQLVPILQDIRHNPTLAQLEAAFNIESVTKEFFQKYKELFLNLKDELERLLSSQKAVKAEFERADISATNFAKKLLGQIVFLYFLQKKGWLGVVPGQAWGRGPKNFLRSLFEKQEAPNGHDITYSNFFNDVLEPLFYEALAIERPGNVYPRLNCCIPFLNGGLFEPVGGYNWQGVDILLNNERFEDIFKTFDLFNFTVREDEPLEKEVAVDPEMLGKVFENLLEVTDRKSKGAFYTPREIVHYMCQESLINYLDSKLKAFLALARADTEAFIRQGEFGLEQDAAKASGTKSYEYQLPQTIRHNATAIDAALANIKICDPAIGSGAFPVGLMQEIVKARTVLTTHLASSPSQGSFDTQERTPYAFKRHAIQESIYGVDIERSAVDIAKLRLWLSLVVDEESYDHIQPLPNLDYKIVCGNALLGVQEDLLNRPLFEEIEELKPQHLAATDPAEKRALKSQIDALIAQLTHGNAQFDFKIYFSEVFSHNGGFDVVIGNPPYVQLQKNRGALAKLYQKARYKTFARTGDIYALFYEKGYQVLSLAGHLCYITSNKWMRAGYGKKLRSFFTKYTTPKTLIDFGDAPLFANATTYTNILLFGKNKSTDISCHVFDLSHKSDLRENLAAYLSAASGQFTALFSADRYLIVNHTELNIKRKVEQQGTALKEWEVKINYGIKTGYNKAFIINGAKRAELIAADPKSAEIIKPILRGKNIKRYKIDWQDLYIIATFPSLKLNIDDYPAVKKYLQSFGRKLEQSGQQYRDASGQKIKCRKKTRHKWFETQDSIGYYRQFDKDKIVWAEIVFDSAFYYDADKYYMEATGFMMTGENIKYLVALLNSRLLTYAFRNYFSGGDLRGNTFRYKKAFLQQLPIMKTDAEMQQKLEGLVEQIQQAKAANPAANTAALEAEIDQLVYQLYGLTTEEIAIVEGAGKKKARSVR
jgi:hypothetical protein